MRSMHGVLCSLVLLAACSREPDSPVPGVKRSESELRAYVGYQHDWKALAHRQRVEREAEEQRLRSQIAPGGNGSAQDSAFAAFLARQDEEMTRFTKDVPKGPMASALSLTIAGIGRVTGDSHGTTYTPRHDDEQLGRARAYYGDKFVSWVLKHEAEINAKMSEDQ